MLKSIMEITRILKNNVQVDLFKGKAVIIYGPRQVGKTTLVKEIIQGNPGPSVYLNCDEPDIRERLTNKNSAELLQLIGEKNNLVVIDEAQRVSNIGLTLKLIVDNFPEKQVIATGSSAFDLANVVVEPLTGRNFSHFLYPISESELQLQTTELELTRSLEVRLLFGSYPQVLTADSSEKGRLVNQLAGDNLFRDILSFDAVKNSTALRKLLQALALQIGNLVSYREIAELIGVDKNTVERYVDLLEKVFVIFRLSSLNRNPRNELKKLRKIYFWDLGIRNALINNFNSLDLRTDAGQMWENYLISERMKYNSYYKLIPNYFFWRTHDQKEVDFVEESGGKLTGFEIKWGSKTPKAPALWQQYYPNSSWSLVNRENYRGFVAPNSQSLPLFADL